jgi:hypothetical protein
MEYWLKLLGGGARGKPLRNDWQNERRGLLLTAATFGKRPRMRVGDGIVYYASGRRLIFAAGEVEKAAVDSGDGTDWPWRVEVSLPLKVEFVSDGVPLDHLDVGARPGPLKDSIKQKSYIRLRPEEYDAAVRGLRRSM